ncbi:hypothetical protein AB0F81_34640 [Actinoplanes sp. NPDC024001]|uniref:hypothetical protein n=1 Tax=Actinoplanes sp. NPDC024001 TaxID=3154598 RepID=UPI0033F2F42F
METDAHRALTDAIRDLLTSVKHHRAARDDLPRDLTDRLQRINSHAAAAAATTGYLRTVHPEDPPAPARETFGRRLTLRTLHMLGILGLVTDPSRPAIPDQVVPELSGYLAGPAVPGERMYVTDANLPLTAAREIAGWTLTRIGRGDLDPLTPLPSTLRHADNPWDEALRHGGCVVLRRTDPGLRPRTNTMMPATLGTDLTETVVSIAAWAPLLLINLAACDRVVVAAEYEIEPGRVVDRIRGTGLGLLENGDGDTLGEHPAWGPFQPRPDEADEFLDAVTVLEPYLQEFLAWPALTKKQGRDTVQAAEGRLRQSTHRLLAISALLGVNGDVIQPRDRPEVTAWTVSALEHLLVPDWNTGELARKVAQRTAVLIGAGDDDRVAVHRDVKKAYTIRSNVAHGSPLTPHQLEELAVLPSRLYGYLREVFRALIILGPRFTAERECDTALLSRAVRHERIRGPVQEAIARLPPPLHSLRADTYR